MTTRRQLLLILPVVLALGACKEYREQRAARIAADSVRRDSTERARQDSINRARPDYVIDSIFTPEEGLKRFRKTVPGDSATRLVGGSTSREALVRRFVTALAKNDTNDLRAMVVHGREFADLYYMDSPYSHPPYQQQAGMAWTLIQNPSIGGLTRLIQKFGGKPIKYVSHKCDPKSIHEGRTTRYAGCLIVLVEPDGKEYTRRYFGSIIEIGGQFKFLSYSNQL
jgi:hypothetical protein